MTDFDLVVRKADVATAGDRFVADIGVRAGVVVALGTSLSRGTTEIDAAGRLVTPGGVDAPCHLDQPLSDGSKRDDSLLKLQQAALAAPYAEDLQRRPDAIDPDLRDQIALGMEHSGRDIARVLLLREHLYASLAAFFDRYDLLLCPTAPVVSWPVDLLGPPEIGGAPAGPRGHAAYTPLFNTCQVPACSVPVGLVDGLPVGLQIVGPRYADATVLAMAAMTERLGLFKLSDAPTLSG